jgi:type II secretory ATPase GspE/PulE/Tfp pilus assembly ATPase PilB-like protein
MRLLDRSATLLSLDQLGLAGQNLRTVMRLIRQSHGIILVTGPTGSGKTTTLYAALQKINSNEKNIITIEDPIEYQLAGVGQMQVNPKIELTFANGLRSILRQDPDVIMVGEIRDMETAEIAIHAALTGHLVFSTLHTNDSFGAVTRLVDMGIEPFLVSSSVNCIVAQRLARRVCEGCKETDPEVTHEALVEAGLPEDVAREVAPVKGRGCRDCSETGYKGRFAVYEVMELKEELKEFVLNGASALELKREAIRLGMKTLRQSALSKLREGHTTLKEVLRVSAADH